MLEIVQAGQFGKSKLLFDMHRLRKRVFKDRMGWDVHVSPTGLETDQFDLPNAIYLLALDDDRRVIGNWRLLPTSGPTMIGDVWPQFLETITMPSSTYIWEASRFAIDVSHHNGSEEGLALINRATQELFCGLTELCILCGIREVYTMYDMRIARLLKRLNCPPCANSQQLRIGDHLSQVGAFATNADMLFRLRKASGVTNALITPSMLPPFLQAEHKNRPNAANCDGAYEAAE